MKHVLFGAKQYLPQQPDLPFVDNGLRRLFSFWDNEAIDDVTERFVRQFVVGTAVPNQVSGGMLNCVGTQDVFADSESYYIPPSKPFCIQGKFRLTALPVTNSPAQLIGVWDSLTAGQRGWAVWAMSDGVLRFVISDNGGPNVALVSTAPGAIKINTAYHFAVARNAANKVTIYIDGVEKGSATISLGSTRLFERVATKKEVNGAVWDLAISDKVTFSAPFTPPGKYVQSNPTPTYPTDVAADIVAQFGFRRDDPHNEVTGKPFAFNSGASLLWGNLRTNSSAADTFSTDIDYYGAKDFTYEFKFRIGSLPTAMTQLLGHQALGGSEADRHGFSILSDGRMFAALTVGGAYSNMSTPVGTIAANVFYHIVVERVGTVISLYVNGVLKATRTNAGDALGYPTGNKIAIGTGGSMTRYIWDIRIAKRAMYRGVVVEPAVLPKMPVDYKSKIAACTMRVGSATTTQGVAKGFAKNFLYGGTSLSVGELYPQVYWNASQSRMIRIKAIFAVGANAVIAYAPSNEPRQSNTPTCTNLLRIGNETFDLNFISPPPTKANNNDNSCFYASVLGTVLPGDEGTLQLQFV